MVYVYEIDGQLMVIRNTQPQVEKVIQLDRMPPMPYQNGYMAILRADFDTQKVWYELVETLEGAKSRKKAEILAYDSSPAVNEFTLGGRTLWLTPEERASLKILLDAEKAAGKTSTVLWHKEQRFDIDDIDMGLLMLIQLELYASEAHGHTQQHLATVSSFETNKEVNDYEFQNDYPPRPVL
jgi:hypothetical protein